MPVRFGRRCFLWAEASGSGPVACRRGLPHAGGHPLQEVLPAPWCRQHCRCHSRWRTSGRRLPAVCVSRCRCVAGCPPQQHLRAAVTGLSSGGLLPTAASVRQPSASKVRPAHAPPHARRPLRPRRSCRSSLIVPTGSACRKSAPKCNNLCFSVKKYTYSTGRRSNFAGVKLSKDP